MIEAFDNPAFGRTDPFTVGAEEELILIDPSTKEIAHTSEGVLQRMAIPIGSAHTDYFAALIEFTSPICSNAIDAVGALARLRRSMRAAGASAIGVGMHPTAQFGDVIPSRGERYRWVENSHVGAVRRTPEAAFHVHVGMPDETTAIRVFNGLRTYIPVLVALAANSPYWYGRDSGFASARTISNKAYPRFEVPRAFRDFDDYATTIETLIAAGELPDYTLIWWDVRLHPRLGTIEVRAMDAQSSLRAETGLAALLHGLAHCEATTATKDDIPREILAENCFRACRFGLDSTIWVDGSLTPMRTLVEQAVARARPKAADVGSDAALEEVERILHAGNGAERQRQAAARGGIDTVLNLLVSETMSDL